MGPQAKGPATPAPASPGTATTARGRRRPPLAQLAHVHRRAWYIWLPGVVVTVLLAAGLAVFAWPAAGWQPHALGPGIVSTLPTLALGLLAIVLLESLYVADKIHELRELRNFVLAISDYSPLAEEGYPHDSLTGILDRRALPDVLRRETSWVDRYRIPLCLAICDIYGFKSLNEKQGNMAGDLVLKDLAQALRNTVRQTDTILRYGGDEFLCLLPRTDATGGEAFTRRVRQACQSFAHLRDVALDFGIAVYEAGADANATLANAESALAAHRSSAHPVETPVRSGARVS